MVSIRALAKRAHHGPADVIIGKKGITEEVLNEIKARLKAKGVVKVKILKKCLEVTGLSRRDVARIVSERLDAKLAGIRGRTFVIYYENEKEKILEKFSTAKPRADLRAKNLPLRPSVRGRR
jgi:RNA-binding protein